MADRVAEASAFYHADMSGLIEQLRRGAARLESLATDLESILNKLDATTKRR